MQSLAIAYAMKRKRKKMAEGGETAPYDNFAKSVKDAFSMGEAKGAPPSPAPEKKDTDPATAAMKKAFHAPGYAEGGMVHPCENCGHVSHPVENQDDHEDMVGEIMKKRHMYSEGGKVANKTPPTADFESAEYDDLVKDDDLEEHYTGKNSGDEEGDEAEDEDRKDMVSQIMKSRKKKGKMPHPA
jgi:hypothetical protein